jgi:hypothetical protein
MSYRERPTVMTKYRVEDLSYRQQGAVDASLAYSNHSPESVRRVAYKYDNSLTVGVSDLAHCDGGNVSGGSEARWRQVARSEPS